MIAPVGPVSRDLDRISEDSDPISEDSSHSSNNTMQPDVLAEERVSNNSHGSNNAEINADAMRTSHGERMAAAQDANLRNAMAMTIASLTEHRPWFATMVAGVERIKRGGQCCLSDCFRWCRYLAENQEKQIVVKGNYVYVFAEAAVEEESTPEYVIDLNYKNVMRENVTINDESTQFTAVTQINVVVLSRNAMMVDDIDDYDEYKFTLYIDVDTGTMNARNCEEAMIAGGAVDRRIEVQQPRA